MRRAAPHRFTTKHSAALVAAALLLAGCTSTTSGNAAIAPSANSLVDSTAAASSAGSVGLSTSTPVAPSSGVTGSSSSAAAGPSVSGMTSSASPSVTPSSAPAPSASTPGNSGTGSASNSAGGSTKFRPVTLPVKVHKYSSGGVSVLTTVTVHGKPYLFVVDSGASTSVIDSSIADELGLTTVGPPGKSTGLGCSAPSHRVRLDNWSVGGEALPPDVIGATKVSLAGGKINGITVAGLLGAEVYRAFGSLRLDYAGKKMTLGGTATAGHPSFPVRVATHNGAAELVASVTLHGRTGEMLVDTGSSRTAVDAAVATELSLTKIGKPGSIRSVSCSTPAQNIRIDLLKTGSVTLPTVTGISTKSTLGAQSQGRVIGLIGSDLLSTYGVVTLDYAGAKVTLGG